MKRIKIFLMSALTILAMTFTTSVFAWSIGFGVTGTAIAVSAEGAETEATNGTETESSLQKANASNNTAIGSIFAEYTFDLANGITFGFDYIPGSAKVNSRKLTRSETAEGKGASGDSSGATDYTAQAEIENHMMAYAEVGVYEGLYLTAGLAQMDVITLESGNTNSGTYGNKTIDGLMLGLGYKGEFSENLYYKVSGAYTDYDSFTLTSSTSNVISAELDTLKASFSLGYRF